MKKISQQILKRHRLALLGGLLWTLLPILGSSVCVGLLLSNSSQVQELILNYTWVWVLLSGVFLAMGIIHSSAICIFSGYYLGMPALFGIIVSYGIALSIGYLFAGWLDPKGAHKYWSDVSNKTKIQEWLWVMLMRFLPLLSFSGMNMALRLAGISFWVFVLGGIFGAIPRAFLLCILGSKMKDIQEISLSYWEYLSENEQFTLSFSIFSGFIFIIYFIRKKIKSSTFRQRFQAWVHQLSGLEQPQNHEE